MDFQCCHVEREVGKNVNDGHMFFCRDLFVHEMREQTRNAGTVNSNLSTHFSYELKSGMAGTLH